MSMNYAIPAGLLFSVYALCIITSRTAFIMRTSLTNDPVFWICTQIYAMHS